jgi:ABC-type Zn uptake system ZnuABC Zn-binding protein ZnuA
MTLSDEHRKFYEQSLEVTKEEIEGLDRQIAAELAKVKDRLTELQKAKKATLQMYAAACNRLGIPNDLADADHETPSIG